MGIVKSDATLEKAYSYVRSEVASLSRRARGIAWGNADRLLALKTEYPDVFDQAIEDEGLNSHTVANRLSLSRKFPPGQRIEWASMGHYEQVWGMTVEQANAILCHAKAAAGDKIPPVSKVAELVGTLPGRAKREQLTWEQERDRVESAKKLFEKIVPALTGELKQEVEEWLRN